MFTSIRKFFSAPTFPDNEEKTRRARLLHVILVAQTYVLLLAMAGTLSATIEGQNRAFEFIVMVAGLGLIVFWRFLMRRNLVSLPSIGMLIFFLLSVTSILVAGGTIRSAGVIFYPSIVVTATLLVNRRAGVIFFFVTCLVSIALVIGEINGSLPTPENSTSFASIAIIIAGMGLTLVLLYLATQSTDDALKQAKAKEQEIRELAGSLEKRVEERTKALATSAEVSRRLSTILDPARLAHEVVEQIQTSFNYYHAHIYLLDQAGKELIMAGGTGEAGRTMLLRGHKIPVGAGLVGNAAQSNKMILVQDTTRDPDWLPNPLLPETKSEVAIPIVLGERVLGVLDVQHNIINGLKDDEAALLQSIAYQVAVALRNAQTYSQTQVEAEREALINEIGRKIQNTSSVESALQVTVRELGQALGVRASRVVLGLSDSIMNKKN
ncbi:MAG TPA: GAF domain-containing protein [Anaerolineales bacterium]|nr:GAF domain-containing protein [Anaerolineales bacterium]HNB34918.1 GAF domain-containing protein [Anaerolineales bacterium]